MTNIIRNVIYGVNAVPLTSKLHYVLCVVQHAEQLGPQDIGALCHTGGKALSADTTLTMSACSCLQGETQVSQDINTNDMSAVIENLLIALTATEPQHQAAFSYQHNAVG